ncbi:hypothetical protein FRC00_011712, partial [Tulasnella sp. 408]
DLQHDYNPYFLNHHFDDDDEVVHIFINQARYDNYQPTASTTKTSTTSTSTSTPTGAWASALAKASRYEALIQLRITAKTITFYAKTAVAKLSTADKVSLATGTMWQKGPCVGNTAAISSIGFPGLCLQDGPVGVRFADKISVFPAGVNAAASWNRDLIRQRAAALGAEFKGKGVHVALAPAMNLARTAASGRNWEGFG